MRIQQIVKVIGSIPYLMLPPEPRHNRHERKLACSIERGKWYRIKIQSRAYFVVPDSSPPKKSPILNIAAWTVNAITVLASIASSSSA